MLTGTGWPGQTPAHRRLGSTRPNIATGWELEIITMVILGGLGIAGSTRTIGGVMLAVLPIGS